MISQVAELSKELESVTALSKEQKEEINSLTAQLNNAATVKSELENEIAALQTTSSHNLEMIETLEAEKVRFHAYLPFESFETHITEAACEMSLIHWNLTVTAEPFNRFHQKYIN